MKLKFRRMRPAFFAAGTAALGLMAAQAPAAETITIVGDGSSVPFRFEPATVTVKRGDEVTWVNKTKVEHSVTPNKGSQKKLKGKDLEAGETYSAAVKSGPIKYHCKYHPGMHGTIMVSAH
jgi:plastocyanin